MTSVYVIASEGGPVKVGIATDLAKRLTVLRSSSPLPLRLAYVQEVECYHKAASIEATACSILNSNLSHGSWFKVPVDVAIGAIQRAVQLPHSRSKAGAQRAAYGEALRSAREAKGWSADRLALEVGVTVDAVLATENGRGYDSERRKMLVALTTQNQ